MVPAYFADYERAHGLPVLRPVRVDEVVEADDGLLEVRAGDRRWLTRTVVNATGTWSRPFVPAYPGAETFRGRQLHTHDYPGPEAFRGERVVVVGGGASAVQLLGEIAPVAADTLWVTRREPVWRTDDFTPEVGRAAVALVEDRVRRGLPPASVVSVTGLALREQEREAERLGAYERHPMFDGHRARRRADAGRHALAGRRDPVGHRLPAGRRPPRPAAPALARTAASSSTAPPRSPTRGCSWSATAPRPAPSAPTGPVGSPPAASPRWLGRSAAPSMASSA